MSIAESLITDFQQEAERTRKYLECVPDDLAWKPHEKSMSMGQLASHIADGPKWIDIMLQDEFDAASLQDWKPFEAASRSELLEAFEKNAATFREAVSGKSDDFMRSDWTMRRADKVMMNAPKHAVIRDFLIHHWVHHRGQLSVYLRMQDVPVPPTFGQTADFPEPPAEL